MIILVIIIIILLSGLAAIWYKQQRRNRLLANIDMSILEVSVPGCQNICFYLHPDKAQATSCEVDNEYDIKQLVPDYTDNLSLYCEKGVFILEQNNMNCRIRITDKGIMPSGDPMLQGVLTRIQTI